MGRYLWLIVTAGALLAPSVATASITLPGHNSWSVKTSVDSKDAGDTLAYGLDSPQQQTVCADCQGGESAALGMFNGGTELIAFMSDLSCDPVQSFLSTGANAQVTQPAGPLTWQIAWDDGGGGPFCEAADADFNDLVTTISASYRFNGFFQPVDNLPTLNGVKAGQSIPVNFSLSGNAGLDIFASGYPQSQQIACDSSEPLDDIEQTVTTGNSSLSYDGTDTYTYVWKTDKAWANTCRQLDLRLNDGTDHVANFQFKK